MKKGLFLLTSLIVTTAAVTPMLQQNNTQKNTANYVTSKSLDIVDLTMPWWGYTKAAAPNLTELLNKSLTPGEYPLISSKMILTATDGTTITATSDFDNSTLRALLGRQGTHFNNVQLEVASQSYGNYVMAYYSYWDASAGIEKDASVVINRFYSNNIDKIDHFWTEGVQFEFELVF